MCGRSGAKPLNRRHGRRRFPRREWRELTDTCVAVPLRCEECGRRWDEPAERWRIFFTDDDPPEPASYCPECAAGEFETEAHGLRGLEAASPREALQAVRDAAATVALSSSKLELAIREARKTLGLRDIAIAAGLSHEKVRQICGEARASG
jgi:hypothetical protein